MACSGAHRGGISCRGGRLVTDASLQCCGLSAGTGGLTVGGRRVTRSGCRLTGSARRRTGRRPLAESARRCTLRVFLQLRCLQLRCLQLRCLPGGLPRVLTVVFC